jgi:hydrogenase maturation protein HypF
LNPAAHTIRLAHAAPARVLACGAYLKNRACLVDGDRVHWSGAHGDLGDADSRTALLHSVEALCAAARGPLQAVAHDLHPDFFSTQVALELARQHQVPAIAVQHHHAHAAVVVADQGLQHACIGITLDGMGLGTDGRAWGGELLWVGGVHAAPQWRRLEALAPLALAGGDAAAREPWRLAAAVLHGLGRGDEIVPVFGPLVGNRTAETVRSMLAHDLQCPPSSSAGRWFDAAAGALGLCLRQEDEAAAAMALEAAAWGHLADGPGAASLPVPASLDLAPLVAHLLGMRDHGPAAIGRGAAWFHQALAGGLAQAAWRHARAEDCAQIVLAGGCMANRLLLRLLRQELQDAGMQVFTAQAAACGDAGLALGQAWVGAWTVAAQDNASRSQALALEY